MNGIEQVVAHKIVVTAERCEVVGADHDDLVLRGLSHLLTFHLGAGEPAHGCDSAFGYGEGDFHLGIAVDGLVVKQLWELVSTVLQIGDGVHGSPASEFHLLDGTEAVVNLVAHHNGTLVVQVEEVVRTDDEVVSVPASGAQGEVGRAAFLAHESRLLVGCAGILVDGGVVARCQDLDIGGLAHGEHFVHARLAVVANVLHHLAMGGPPLVIDLLHMERRGTHRLAAVVP